MKTLHRRCAGLDVHSDSVVACARLTVRTKASHEVRRFSTATRDLVGTGGLVGGARGHARSDGGHWHLLEADLAHPGGQV